MSLPWDPGYGPLIETRLRIVTWNLWGRYGPFAERHPVIVENLSLLDPDVICLQEAWEEQPDDIATKLGMPTALYAPAFEKNGGWSGNAVLARWPVVRSDIVELPMEGGGAVDNDEGERRLLLFVELDGPRGPIQVFCTHLSWRIDWSGVRQAQLQVVCDYIASMRPRPYPAMLCGDLNASPDSDEIRRLRGLAPVYRRGVVFRDAWTAGKGDGATISARNPYALAALDDECRIDYILVGQPKLGGGGQVLRAWVAGDMPRGDLFPSDHFAVAAELRY